MIPVGFISTMGRLRDVDQDQVARLAESIDEVGLLNPITVYAREIIRNGQAADGYGLVAGAHRLEACKRLGWQELPAIVVDLDDDERIIAECDENLCGTKLTASEQAMFTAKRKEAYLRKHPETGHGKATADKDCNVQSFAADTASKTGQDQATVSRHASRGEKISPAALAMVKGTSLDTGAFLDRLKKVKPENQPEYVQRELDSAKKPKPKSAAPHAPDPDDDYSVRERQVSALISAWNKAGKEAREQFLDRIGAA